MKILYIQHTSVLGGSSKSLLELMENLPKDVVPHVLCPKGPYSDLLQKKGIKVFTILGIPQFDNTRFGYYRGLRWLILLREFLYLPFLFFKLLQLKKHKFDIVHINEITQIYSIIFSKLFLGKIVVHARSMQCMKKNLRYKIILKMLKKYSDIMIAIDKSVESTLDSSLNIKVIHNGLSINHINLKKNDHKKFTVGIVSNFQRYKGILEFIDAANICINEKKLDIDFHIFGASYQHTKSLKESIFQLFGFREDLDKIIRQKILKYKLNEKLLLKGYVYNSDDIYNNISLLTFPSYLNAAGRPVFEAAFYRIPSIIAIENPLPDTIIDQQTGICIREKNFQDLAYAIEKLYTNPEMLKNLGDNAYILANQLFNSQNNAKNIFEIYQTLKNKDTSED